MLTLFYLQYYVYILYPDLNTVKKQNDAERNKTTLHKIQYSISFHYNNHSSYD